MKLTQYITFFTCLFFLSFQSKAQNPLQSVDSLVRDKQYNQASLLYENYIKTDSLNSSVYYNLGSCYFFQGKYGLAVWAFEKSLKYNPKDVETIANLEICYQKLNKSETWKPTISSFERNLYGIGTNFWGYLSIICALLLGGSFFLFFTAKKTAWKKIQLLFSGFLLVLTATSVFVAYSSNDYYKSSNYAIVIVKEIHDQTNMEAKKSRLTLQEGDRVMILEDKKDEYLVELGSKEVCEIPKNSVLKI